MQMQERDMTMSLCCACGLILQVNLFLDYNLGQFKEPIYRSYDISVSVHRQVKFDSSSLLMLHSDL